MIEEEEVGHTFEMIGQEVELKVDVAAGILGHKADGSMVVNSIVLVLVA
jgi:hypothetical protein